MGRRTDITVKSPVKEETDVDWAILAKRELTWANPSWRGC